MLAWVPVFAGMTVGIFFTADVSFANDNVLNIYAWYDEISETIIDQFEKETGIHVNFSTFDNNETLYAKLKANPYSGYDIVEPSSYYVNRMSREGLIQKIDKTKLSNYKNLDPDFLNVPYDPKNEFSVPYIWGATGIFVNKRYFNPNSINSWTQFWAKKYYNQLMMLNDPREVFAMALMALGYSVNDSDPEHIRQAYLRLKNLLPNIKVFASDTIPSIFIDEDATIGMAWNGDIERAIQENPNLTFIYPKEGYIVWVETFTIPKNAPHLENAYKFINFMMRPEIANHATLVYGYLTANLAGRKLLPQEIRDNKRIFPDKNVLKRREFQTDISDQALALYAKYWEMLKIGA
jgi:spermidine/putrescine transport system substrate-binding protein